MVGSVLAERVGQGEVGGCTPLAAIAAACRKALVNAGWAIYRKFSVEKPWSMPFDPQKFSVEKPWSMPGWPFIHYLAQTGIENAPFTFFRQILVWRSVLWLEGPDY